MNKDFFREVLVLSPHTDDGELAAGGTIARFIEEDSNVTYIAFSAPRQELRTECAECLKVLGVDNFEVLDFPRRHFPKERQEILQYLYDYNQSYEIDLVLTPSTQDLHQDHQTITREAMRAFKHSSILGYELPWNHIVFHENCFVTIEERHVNKKLNALSHYKTQENRHYFDMEYLRGLMRSRGVQVGEKFAESYEVIKLVLS